MTVEFLIQPLLDDILQFHTDLEQSDIPVSNGIRDMNLLESAINEPFKTFAGEDLYPGISLKAARLCFGIATNHAFVDGKKRVAVHAMEVFLLANGLSLESTDDEMENIILGVAAGELSYKDLAIWIEKYISR